MKVKITYTMIYDAEPEYYEYLKNYSEEILGAIKAEAEDQPEIFIEHGYEVKVEEVK